ncbi:hypothetical protein ABZ614_22045 [Streptomyces sp. NPDC013178]
MPTVGPLIGGPVDALPYRLLISRFLPVAEQEPGRVPAPDE